MAEEEKPRKRYQRKPASPASPVTFLNTSKATVHIGDGRTVKAGAEITLEPDVAETITRGPLKKVERID